EPSPIWPSAGPWSWSPRGPIPRGDRTPGSVIMGAPTERRPRHGAREGQGREASQEDRAEVDQGEARGEEGQEVHRAVRVARVRGPAPGLGRRGGRRPVRRA